MSETKSSITFRSAAIWMRFRSLAGVGRAGAAGLAILTLLIAGCSEPERGPSKGETPATASRGQSEFCSRVGPMNCAVNPVADLEGEACDRLRACLELQSGVVDGVGPRFACDAPQFPAAAGPIRVAALPVSLDLEGVPSHAAYLFLGGDPGWCPGHELLRPQWNHGGYCDSVFAFEWTTAQVGEGDTRLSVTSSRVCYMPLDQKEIAAGESDIASQECSRSTFDLVDGRLQPGERIDDESMCRAQDGYSTGGK